MARRNANGEGSIYKRKDGRWEGAAYLPTASDRRRRVRVYGATRQEARDKLTTIMAQVQHGTLIPDRTWKLDEYLDYWLERGVGLKRRALTYRRHENIVRLYLKPGLGKRTLNSLSVQIVQDYLDQLYADGRSAATIHQVRKVLSAALTYAMRKELLSRNVARLVELPSYKANEAKHWTLDETIQFLKAAQSDPFYAAFTLLALYGLRRGEVIGIRWRDVDFEQGVLHIKQQIQRIDGELKQVELKTHASRRDEPLLASVRDVLIEQHTKQATARATAGKDWQGVGTDEELVFTTKTGRPIESRNLYRSFLRICEQHGIQRITLHGMRHTNATTQKNLQVHDRDIQAILGHGDVRTTGIYEHVDLSSKRDALEKVEQRLFYQQAVENSGGSRQMLPSTKKKLHRIGEVLSGGSSQTRTGDTRLFRPIEGTLHEQLTSIDQEVEVLRRKLKLGCVAVYFTVNGAPSKRGSWQDVRLPPRKNRGPS